MSLYVETQLDFNSSNIICTVGSWHPMIPLLAVGSFNQDKGGSIYVFDDDGLVLEDCEWPVLLSNQVTALAWHPSKKLLVVGWDGGELYIWLECSWARLEAPHTTALSTISFSTGGGRLVTVDAAGSCCGWQCGSGAPLTSFHHNLTEVVSHITFCSIPNIGDTSNNRLTKMSTVVNDYALDALAAWRPRTTAKVKEASQPDNYSFYAAQDNGVILFVDVKGVCTEVFNAAGRVVFMSLMNSMYLLIAWELNGSLNMTRFITSSNGSLKTNTHVKMAARISQSIITIGNYSVAVIAADNLIRIWDSETGENDSLPNEEDLKIQGDIFTSICYCNLNESLCCGTSQGNLYLWRRNHKYEWKLVSSTSVKGTIKNVFWGSESILNPLLFVNCITSAFILREQPISWAYTPSIWMVQKSANEVLVTRENNIASSVKTDIKIRALAFKDQYVVMTDGKDVQIWMCSKQNDSTFSLVRTFQWKTDVLILHNDVLVGVVNPHIECYSVSGSSLGNLPTTDNEGEPIAITNTGKYVVIVTMDGTLKLAEITKKGLRMPYPAKNCYQMIEDFGEVMRASVNSSGRYICMSIANAGLAPDPKLYLWDVAYDVISTTNLSENIMPPYHSVPIAIVWNANDPRFLVVHVRSVDLDSIHLLCCHDGKLYEHKNWSPNKEDYFMTDFMLCSFYTPYVIILSGQNIMKIMINEFNDVDHDDSDSRKKIMDFIYFMSSGQLEKAVIAGTEISSSKSKIVWDSLARVCVLCNRADVGAVCLGKMDNIKGALMLYKAMEDEEMNEKCEIGILAVNLGMLDMAEKLFHEAQRPDLVTRLIASKEGGLDKLINGENEGENTLLIKNALHKLAKVHWANGEMSSAIKLFEKAGTLVPHVPRTLVTQGQTNILAQIVSKTKDTDLIIWWGHYLEGIGDLDGAFDSYVRANDYGEQTRLLCNMNRLDEAQKVCEKNKISMFQMARYLEMQPEETENTVKLYMKCGAITSAIRVAAEANAWKLVYRAGQYSAIHALHAAAILENAGLKEEAIVLYQKAKKPHMALKLALSSGDMNAVVTAISSLENKVDPELAVTLAEHLKRAEHYSQAAELLATAGKYEEALDIVESSSAPLSPEMASRLAAPAGSSGRDVLLRRLADLLGARGLYHEAAKRLASIGDKAGAMRWLLRSGDADRIATFAAASRDRNAQMMAGDYLRRRDVWRSRADMARHIHTFYTRARAHDRLAAFYAERAKHEADEFDNYEKALEYLKEATKCLSKSTEPETGNLTVALQEQIVLVKRYMEITKMLEMDTNAGVKIGQQLLNDLSGRPGLVTQEKLLKLLLLYASNHPDSAEWESQLKALDINGLEEKQTLDSPDQSIEEAII